MNIPFTRSVRTLVIANVAIFILGQVVLQLFMRVPISGWFALYPGQVIYEFRIWQLFSYMFLHSVSSITHIVFNMLMLWMIGSELESKWGSKKFLFFYFFSGVGAALIYVFGVTLYSIVKGETLSMMIPVMGASGALYGLMLAYGLLFGDRMMYFFMLFPIKARYFVMILGLIEFVTLLSSGVSGGEVANLAHLGGLASGYVGLLVMAWWQRRPKKPSRKGGLRLVVDNEKDKNKAGGPRYWN